MASGSEKSPLKGSNAQGRKTAEEEIYWTRMKKVRFLVVLSGNFQQKLSIPKKFAENMRAIILNPKITLHGPSGISWDVALMMGADGLFLQEGWEEFVAAHSLQENDALIFKYDRKASFHVKIFNGECEKEASYFVKRCGHVMQAIEHQKEGDSSEIVEEAEGDDEAIRTPSKKARVQVRTETDERQGGHDRTKTNMMLRQRRPVQRAVNVLRRKMLRSSKKPPEPVSNTEPEGAEGSNQDSPANKDVPSQDQNSPEANNDPEINLDKGLSVTRRRRPRKCNASSVKRFTLPAEPEGAEEPNQDSPANKEVPSKDQNSPETNGNDPESNLDEGLSVTGGGSRKCTASEKRMTSPVECYVSNRRPVTEEEKNEAVRLALENLTEKSFIAIMRKTCCYKGFSMSIPSYWAQEFLGPKNQTVILRMGEKTWSIRYCFSRRALGPGWKQFALENNLEEFDTCLLKLVSPDYADVMLDVTIFRVVEDVTPPTRR